MKKKRRTHRDTIADDSGEVGRVSSDGVAGNASGDTDVTRLRSVEVEDQEVIVGDRELVDLGRREAELLSELSNGGCVETRGECSASKSKEACGGGSGEHLRRKRKL